MSDWETAPAASAETEGDAWGSAPAAEEGGEETTAEEQTTEQHGQTYEVPTLNKDEFL